MFALTRFRGGQYTASLFRRQRAVRLRIAGVRLSGGAVERNLALEVVRVT